eukprot:3165514-Rhodomonas_salina.1
MGVGDDAVLNQAAMGRDVQLGMLFDGRSGDLFGGVSLWTLEDIKKNEEIKLTPQTLFQFSTNVEDVRKHAGLNAEGSVAIDFGMFALEGSASYLQDSKKHVHEARVDVSCLVTKQTRRIPQETLAAMRFENRLDNPRFTHFVAEVVEGATGNITFTTRCTSAEEEQEISGSLAGKLKAYIPVCGTVSTRTRHGS